MKALLLTFGGPKNVMLREIVWSRWRLSFCAALALTLISSRAQTVTTAPFPTTPDDQTGYFLQTVSINNSSGTNYPGLRVLVRDLPADLQTNIVRIANAHGLTNLSTTITNVPFFDFGAIPVGASLDFVSEVYVSNRRTFPNPRYEAVVTPTFNFVIPSTVLVTNNATRIVDGKFFAEFKSEQGRAYFVQYNTSLTNTTGWKTSFPPVQGTGSTVLWVDDGPPRTESKPTTVTQRFYRVVVVPQ